MSAALLYGTGASVSGEDGLVALADNLGNQLHPALRYAFLIGFWAAAFTSLLGTWHGVSYLFADFVGEIYELSELELGYLTPSRTDFEHEDARFRGIHCYLFRDDGEEMVGSARDRRR